jgi:hypothetical protein
VSTDQGKGPPVLLMVGIVLGFVALIAVMAACLLF